MAQPRTLEEPKAMNSFLRFEPEDMLNLCEEPAAVIMAEKRSDIYFSRWEKMVFSISFLSLPSE